MQFLVRPLESSENYSLYGGAYVSCWIKTQDAEDAEIQARKEIYKAGWLVQKKEDSFRVEEKQYGNAPQSLEYFRQAETDGECYVFHTWPFGAPEEEEDP